MRKVLFLFLLCKIVYAQEPITDLEYKNEIKLHALYLVAGAIEIEYEHLRNTKTAFGIALTVPYRNLDEEGIDYLVTPYYRRYFGKKNDASGFFIEAFGMYVSGNGNYDIVLGPSIGGKFVFRKNYLAELNFGLGAILTTNNVSDFYLPIFPRLGIKIGKRF